MAEPERDVDGARGFFAHISGVTFTVSLSPGRERARSMNVPFPVSIAFSSASAVRLAALGRHRLARVSAARPIGDASRVTAAHGHFPDARTISEWRGSLGGAFLIEHWLQGTAAVRVVCVDAGRADRHRRSNASLCVEQSARRHSRRRLCRDRSMGLRYRLRKGELDHRRDTQRISPEPIRHSLRPGRWVLLLGRREHFSQVAHVHAGILSDQEMGCRDVGTWHRSPRCA